MQFFVEINGQTAKVQVARLPKDVGLLTLFRKTNGSTYTGAPSLFNGLRPGGKNGLYTAISVKLGDPAIEPVEIAETKIQEIVTSVCSEAEETVNVTEDFSFHFTQHEETVPILATTTSAEEAIKDIDFRKFVFDFNYDQVSQSHNQNEAWLTYVNDKSIWIRRYGSEALKLAQEMCCKCDNRYVVERAIQEFPHFEIHEEYALQEVDTPDIAILRFLRFNAFSKIQLETIRKYRSRMVVAFPYDDQEQIPGTEMLVIKGFLGMCDLVYPLAEYIVYVDQQSSSGM